VLLAAGSGFFAHSGALKAIAAPSPITRLLEIASDIVFSMPKRGSIAN
jgi:hypothetical protein